MPEHKCGSSALCLHELGGVGGTGMNEDDAGDFEYLEVDPSGRYGRYKEILGKGAFKTVYRAFDQEDGIEVAWNQVQGVLLQTTEDMDRLYSEVHLLSTLKHKNIIKLYHSWVDKKSNTVNFITEIFTSGTLRQYRKRHKHVDIKAVKNWSRQILRGLLYLHSHDPPIIHRDLKCDNIFINGNQGEVKIGDLGLAAILQHAHARSVIGTPEFMAPELYEEEYTELVDVYSFGMCLLEMVTSEYPYSECSNAAQIYKKVTTGKKPEALKQIKDPELCQFIGKCLAPVSERLPARELLVDPFLQCEGSRGLSESSPNLGRRMRMANGMDDKAVSGEEPHGVSATVQISYVLKETLPAYVYDGSDGCTCLAALDSKASQIENTDISSLPCKEERARSVDFKVNGKLREDDNVFLKLQISGSEGQVRNIHFPFDVEIDTAMCVASEMVAELDLTDQDVTKIAEMIDAAILALVPDWKPGVAIDETCCDGEDTDNKDDGGMAGGCDSVTNDASDGIMEENTLYSVREETASPPSRLEALMYGRFEEVTYQCHRSEIPTQEAEECTVSSEASDLSHDADWSLTDSTSSHEYHMLLPINKPGFDEYSGGSHHATGMRESTTTVAFTELVESKWKTGYANFVHKIWEDIVHLHPCDEGDHDDSAKGVARIYRSSLQSECYQHGANGQEHILKLPTLQESFNGDDDEVSQELAELEVRHQQEMRELQRKHEAARTEVKNRWLQKKRGKCGGDHPRLNCECSNDGDIPESLGNGFQGLRVEEISHGLPKTLPCQNGSCNGSITIFDDLLTLEQESSRSPGGLKERTNLLSSVETVYLPLTVEGKSDKDHEAMEEM